MMFDELTAFATDQGRFPGGDHETGNCTSCARIVVKQYGGRVLGYEHDNNPSARLGEAEYGHDFAIVSHRYLVDPWAYNYYQTPPVIDMDDPANEDVIRSLYGDRNKWVEVPL